MIFEFVIMPVMFGLCFLVNILIEGNTIRRRENGRYTDEIK